MRKKIIEYIRDWMQKGYPDDIPDEVPERLAALHLAPSYKSICFSILKNDTSLQSIWYTPPESKYYYALKGVEISQRKPKPIRERLVQGWLF